MKKGKRKRKKDGEKDTITEIKKQWKAGTEEKKIESKRKKQWNEEKRKGGKKNS